MFRRLLQRDTKFFENSIGIRLLRYVFGCYLLVTVVVTLIQLGAEYSHVKKGVFEEVASLENTFKHSIAESVWTFDRKQLHSTLLGMSQIDVITGIRITDTNHRSLAMIGSVNPPPNATTSPALENRLFEYHFPIVYYNENTQSDQAIGAGYIFFDNNVIIDRVKYGFTLIIINSVIKTFALWFIFLYFTRKFLAVPINELAEQTMNLTPSASDKLSTDEYTEIRYRDELSCLKSKFDEMRHAILDKISIIESHNLTLEKRVEERTAELREVNEEMSGALTHLTDAQDKLIQSEKLSALGALVTGVAHELNTPIGNGLTTVSYVAQSTKQIKKQVAQGITRSDLEKYLDEMEEGSQIVNNSLEKASSLVRSFKQISVDRSTSQRRSFIIKEIFVDTLRTLAPLLQEHDHTFTLNVPDNIKMDSYPGPLGEIVNNLVLNALHHGFKERDNGTVQVDVSSEDDNVRFVFMDNGVGISESDLDHVFDPFFTTSLGQGNNGLGLHIVHNIVTAALGGTISIDSQVDSHTTLTMEFPRVSPNA